MVLHPAAPEDTLERRAARGAFRALIRKVGVTLLAERGRCKVTVVTELAPLVSEGGGGRINLWVRGPAPRVLI